MTEWTPYVTAQNLMAIFPLIGRLIAKSMRDNNEEEMTMMQVRALQQLQHEPITASDLAKKRHTSLQAVSVLVQGLVERGWIVRVPDPNDRRQYLLEVTPAGQERAQAAEEQILTLIAGFLSELTPDEIEAAQIVLPALQRVVTAELTSEGVAEK